jgi:hypothetical protein
MLAFGLSLVYRTDLLIDAMAQFEPEPTMRSVLAGANPAIQ